MRWRRLTAALALPLLLAAGCEGEGADVEEAAPERVVSVTVVEAQAQPVEIVENALGTVRTIAAPDVSAELSARVERLHADTGDSVAEGDLLAELDAEDFIIERDRAEANIDRLEARIENQERVVWRQERLSEQGHVPEANVEDAVTELRALRAELATHRASYAVAERNIARTRITAPYSGTVDDRFVSEGDFVQPGSQLFALATTDVLRVTVPFPETLAGRLQPGMEIRLRTPTAPGNALSTEVSALRPVLGAESRSILAIADIENPGNWRPGASVNAELILDRRESVVVPSRAVVRRPAGEVVYLLQGEEAIEQEVRVGRRERESVEIVEGIAPGDEVIVDGAAFLTDGARVRPQPLES